MKIESNTVKNLLELSNALKLSPNLKAQIWGGSYFKDIKHSKEDIVSESWELSIENGSPCYLYGTDITLESIIEKEDLGENAKKFPYFPMLIKLIDAKENLSVQVHPGDSYAMKYENSFGKNEMWHIIDADEGCGIYVGLNKDCSKEELKQRMEDGSILEVLNFIKVKPGDTFAIRPGTIHAIAKGVRLFEIQQNSVLTYRLYDYLRKDKDGNYRELHIDKALDVINLKKHVFDTIEGELLTENEYFSTSKKVFTEQFELKADNSSYITFTFLDGEGFVDGVAFNRFDTFFLPANKACTIKGSGSVVISHIPNN